MNRRVFLEGAAGATVGFWVVLHSHPSAAEPGLDRLAEAFGRPPLDSRPWVYWFWINGNLTREGITADLEAMQRVGIGGVLIMEVDPGTPGGEAPFGSDAWREMFSHACREAARLDLQINMHNTAGWAGSGGPWITPELSMQKLVWSETVVEGGQPFDAELPRPETTAGYYRDVAVLAFPSPGDDTYRIADVAFKAGFEPRSTPYGHERLGIPPLPTSFEPIPRSVRIDARRIVDLTTRLRGARLSWDPPPGRWTVLRFGHTSTGQDNHPTPISGRGLECDKLSRVAIEAHFAGFLQGLVAIAGPDAGKTLVSTHIDSWEVGAQNWTRGFDREFLMRRGYDITPWLPVMTGRVVGGLEESERFLWDLRETLSELVIENYAGRLRELAERQGMRLSIEAVDTHPCDEMRYSAVAGEPQAEFWYGRGFYPEIYRSWAWIESAASAAHVYGRPIVAAEAFTAMPGEDWKAHPASLKPLGDWAFCQGVNRFVIHRYAMQPWADRRPGMTMGPWGVHYERTQTWWEESRPWHEYLSRCQFLLRQGRPVADILNLQPEGAPMRYLPPGVNPHSATPPDTPGYDADGCPAEAVFTRLTVRDGRIALPDGTSYRLMSLHKPGEQPGPGTMTPRLLRRLAELVHDGMVLVGPRPSRSPSLSGFPACDAEVEQLADQLWGDCDGVVVLERAHGQGRVVWGKTPEQVLADEGLPEDFSCGRASFNYTHRRLDDGTEIYFVTNKDRLPGEAACAFRVGARRPELWWPESGEIERPARYDHSGGRTLLPLRLPEHGSVFVVFPAGAGVERDRVVSVVVDGRPLADAGERIELTRGGDGAVRGLVRSSGRYTLRAADGTSRPLAADLPEPELVGGPWELRFPPGSGAPARLELSELRSWTEHPDPGVRHFSGRATYRKTIRIPDAMRSESQRVVLDLGRVEVIACVTLNGRPLGVLWKPPHRLDVTEAARPGDNDLEVTVVNLWPNRLIGDATLPEDCEWEESFGGRKLVRWPRWLLEGKPSPTGRQTFTTWKVWDGDGTLLPSGLLGPVMLRAARRIM